MKAKRIIDGFANEPGLWAAHFKRGVKWAGNVWDYAREKYVDRFEIHQTPNPIRIKMYPKRDVMAWPISMTWDRTWEGDTTIFFSHAGNKDHYPVDPEDSIAELDRIINDYYSEERPSSS